MKKVLLVLIFGIVCSITTLILANHLTNKPSSIKTTIEAKNEVQKAVVIEKLSSTAQIVGMKGSFKKDYKYKDANFFGGRSFTLTLHGNFKMGFEVKDLIDNMNISNNIIFIKTPRPILIAFEAPFSDAAIKSKVDFFREDFKESDRQAIYKSAVDKSRIEVVSNQSVLFEAQEKTKLVIKSLLSTIPNVERVEFL